MEEIDVQQKARSFLSGIDLTNIRDDLSPYVLKVNAKVVMEELGKGESGYTLTKPNGKHVITVNSLEPPVRQRFTVCHEVAHIALDLPSSHDEVPSGAFAKRHPNEVACDTFAAELLMPYQQWLEAVPQEEPSSDLIERMAATFQVSFPAAASRFASLTDLPCAFVTMEQGMVRYAARSMPLRRAGAWIPIRSPIPVGSIACQLRAGASSATRTEEISQDTWFSEVGQGLDLWELARHYAHSDTTISLIWFDNDDLPEVEVDRFGARVHDDGGLAELTGHLPWPGRSKRR